MPKKPSKPDRSSEYSPIHRQNVLLEDIGKKFDHFGEGLTDLQEKVGKIEKRLEVLDEIKVKVSVMEIAISHLSKDVTTLKSDVNTIKSTFATKKDIEAISTRLTVVEQAR